MVYSIEIKYIDNWVIGWTLEKYSTGRGNVWHTYFIFWVEQFGHRLENSKVYVFIQVSWHAIIFWTEKGKNGEIKTALAWNGFPNTHLK